MSGHLEENDNNKKRNCASALASNVDSQVSDKKTQKMQIPLLKISSISQPQYDDENEEDPIKLLKQQIKEKDALLAKMQSEKKDLETKIEQLTNRTGASSIKEARRKGTQYSNI